jgi:proteic killer suppression protein
LILTFRTKQLERCYCEYKEAVRTFGQEVARRYIQRLNIIKQTQNLKELMALPGLRCHPLKGKRIGQYAINLNGFYRLIFTLLGNTLEIVQIDEVSKHYDG